MLPEGRLVLLLDDTLVNKSGRKVDGAGYYHDAVTTSEGWKVSAATFIGIVISFLPLEGVLFAVLCVIYVQIGRRFFHHRRPFWIAGGVLVTLLAIAPAIAAVYLAHGAPSPASK